MRRERGPTRQRAGMRLNVAAAGRAARAPRTNPALATPLGKVTVADVSALGARVQTSVRAIAVGDWVGLAFTFAGDSYRTLGKVVWVATETSGPVEFGLKFESLVGA